MEPSLGIKIARSKVSKVHSTVQREALHQIIGLLEEQEREIKDLKNHLSRHERILKGE